MTIKEIVKAQREFFASGQTFDVKFRTEALKKLRKAVEANERKIHAALKADLGKSETESYMCETGMTLGELSFMIKHVKSFSRKQKKHTPLAQFCSSTYVLPVPYGTVLIMSPWNYPFQLTFEPLVDALAAGNTAVVKPSAYSPATSAVVAEIIQDIFPPEYVSVVLGGREENAALLEEKFDYIFFTGSKAVGRLVMRKASEHLTPVTLELGGKSPCVVDETAELNVAAKRIAFGKFLNVGQTCVAPDYLLVHKSVKDRFADVFGKNVRQMFGNALQNEDYGKIVNKKHFERILSLIDKDKLVFGGGYDESTLKIEPTLLDNVTLDDAVMCEEIFGPVLPMLVYEDEKEIFDIVGRISEPLAFYLFSSDKERIRRLTERVGFGGGCVNDTIIHLATSEAGFGGYGESGMGAYHGKAGFDAFTHYKTIVDKKTFIDIPVRYQPYNTKKLKTIKRLMK